MGFSASERALLLAVKGVGPTVIARLEQIGYSALDQLVDADPGHIARQVAAMLGTTCWRNSPQAKAALDAVIATARVHSAAKISSKKSSIAR